MLLEIFDRWSADTKLARYFDVLSVLIAFMPCGREFCFKYYRSFTFFHSSDGSDTNENDNW